MKRVVPVVAVFIVIAVIGLWVYQQQETEKNQSLETVQVVMRYSIELKNTSNTAVKDSRASVFLPLNLTQQTLVSLESQPLASQEQKSEEQNYQYVEFEFPLIPPYGEKQINLTTVVDVASEPYFEKDKKTLDQHLKDGELLQIQAPLLVKALESFSEDKPIPQQVFQWHQKNMSYSGYIQEDRGAQYALQFNKGDCTEYMYLMMAMLRASGIPAKGVAGFYLKRDKKIVNANEYHNWVEYFADGRWHIMDPLNNNLDKGYGRYVALKTFDGSKSKGGMTSQRFASYDNRLEISMR